MFDSQKVIQIGVCVEDVDAAIKYYSENFGMGPFWVSSLDCPDAYYRGEKKGQKMKIAMCKLGPMCFELIERVDGYSIHYDFVKERGEGIDHLCFQVTDLKGTIKDMQEKGFEYIEGDPDAGFAYIDSDKVGGMKIEMVEFPEGVTMQGMIDENLKK